VVLGASFDSVEDNRKFAEKFGFPFALLSDTKRTMGIAYGAADDASAATAKRVAYVIGPDGRIKTVFAKASPKSFADDVLAVL
jgi:thioredoxin-dependent peroxiredoxin